MVKVAHVSPYFPPHIGGLQNHVDILSRKLHALGHESTVLSSTIGGGPTNEGIDGERMVHRLPSFEIGHDAFIIGLLRRMMVHRGLHDIVHLHGHLFYSTTVGALAKRLTGVNTIMTFHGDFFKPGAGGRFIKRFRDLTQGNLILGNVDRIISLTSHDARYLESRGADPLKISIVPNGVDLGTFRSLENGGGTDLRARFGVPRDSRMVLFVGRMVDQKGLPYLMKAMPELLKEVPNAHLVVVGEGPESVPSKNLAKTLGVESALTFMGVLSTEDLVKAYNTSQVVAVPSLWEGMPLVILEAAACGTPVVASDVSGISEFVEHGKTGLMTRPRDPGSLSSSIAEILTNTNVAARMTARALAKSRTEFDLDLQVERTVEVYEDVIENESR